MNIKYMSLIALSVITSVNLCASSDFGQRIPSQKEFREWADFIVAGQLSQGRCPVRPCYRMFFPEASAAQSSSSVSQSLVTAQFRTPGAATSQPPTGHQFSSAARPFVPMQNNSVGAQSGAATSQPPIGSRQSSAAPSFTPAQNNSFQGGYW